MSTRLVCFYVGKTALGRTQGTSNSGCLWGGGDERRKGDLLPTICPLVPLDYLTMWLYYYHGHNFPGC